MSTIEIQQNNQKITLANLLEPDQGKGETCIQCGRYFKKISHFNRHQRQRHSEQRNYNCSCCQKTFKRSSHLKRHMISHTHEKTYKCQQCIMAFGYKHHLERHIKVIHLKALLQCNICQMKFIKKKAYGKHMKQHDPQCANIKQQIKKENSGGKKKRIKKNKSKLFVQKLKSSIPTENENCRDLNTATKISCQSEPNNEQIYHSSQSQQVCNQKQMYRCRYQDCFLAFYGLYELKRHLNKKHEEKE